MTAATATPGQRILGQETVLKKVPVSRTTLWRMERAGDFPKRIKVSKNRIGWFEADIEAWLEERKPFHGSND